MKHIFFLIFIVFASININADDVNKISSAYSTQTSDLQVSSRGTVVKLLSDDNKGSRHQRFILKLSNNQTVLVAHNIDLASKITSLRRGDVVEFNGEYEWNSKGGVIHWTHHDPAGRHQDGWLKHNGAIYE
jgi:molybdopterin converting factor small subunit